MSDKSPGSLEDFSIRTQHRKWTYNCIILKEKSRTYHTYHILENDVYKLIIENEIEKRKMSLLLNPYMKPMYIYFSKKTENFFCLVNTKAIHTDVFFFY